MKDIKDYIHLYIGCDVLVDGEHSGMLVGFSHTYDVELYVNNQWLHHRFCKLLLRPLSSMTEEEAFALIKFDSAPHRHASIDIHDLNDTSIWYVDGEMWHGDGVSEMYDKYIKFNELSPDQFHYLLSRGFDLFGLIDAGLAIDATTLKKEG